LFNEHPDLFSVIPPARTLLGVEGEGFKELKRRVFKGVKEELKSS
jgi:hypothetical protein